MGKLAYVSIDIPADFKQSCATVTQEIRDQLSTEGIIFEPVPSGVLHMTIAFLGHKLRNQKKDLHDRLSTIVEDYSARLKDATLKFESYALFPLTKRNLLVATFSVSAESLATIKGLKGDLAKLGLLSEDRETFTAHVTLGKILSKAQHAIDWDSFITGIPHLSDFSAEGCTLRGWD